MPKCLTVSSVAHGGETMMQQAPGSGYCSPEELAQQLDTSSTRGTSTNTNTTTSTTTTTKQQQQHDSDSILVLDCRSPNDFNSSHISGAIHVALPTLMFRRLKNGTLPVASVIKCSEGKEKFNALYRTGTLVLYDQDSSSTSANTSTVIGLLLKKLKEDGCRVRLLEGGFMAFQKGFPMHCVGLKEPGSTQEESTILGLCNLRISDRGMSGSGGVGCNVGDNRTFNPDGDDVPTPNTYNNDPNEFPVKVLPYLYLGNAQNSADLECLYKNDIKYILNVTLNVPNTFEHEGTFKYMQIPISDHWSQNLSQWFLKAIAFIDEARQKKHGVLVHCLAGISRSVTVTVAYLMHSHSLSLEAAYDFVRECKPNISPNFNFLGQLQDFENSLRCDCRTRAGSTSSDEFTCTCSPKLYFSSPTSTTPSSSECGQPESPYVPS